MQLWVYYCDGSGEEKEGDYNVVRLDWDFVEKKWVSGNFDYLFRLSWYDVDEGFAENSPEQCMGKLTIEKTDGGVYKLDYVKSEDAEEGTPVNFVPDTFPDDFVSYPGEAYAGDYNLKGLFHGQNTESKTVYKASSVTGGYPWDTSEKARDSAKPDFNGTTPKNKFIVSEINPGYSEDEEAFPLTAINL